MEHFLSTKLQALRTSFEYIVEDVVAPRAAEVDRDCLWPAHSMTAFARAGLTGLQVPGALGGHGQGLAALSMATETIGRACPSSALCFGMHCVGTAVIDAQASPYHEERYLRPIAAGQHLTTLALSESGSGARFYLASTCLPPPHAMKPGNWSSTASSSSLPMARAPIPTSCP